MPKLILIDGNSLMYRAYFATAYSNQLMANSEGLYTNAIYAFVNMIEKIANGGLDHILVAFDTGEATFRHELYQEYKAGRSPMPDEMRVQIPYLKNYLTLNGIPQCELSTYEADDIIGTMAEHAKKKGYDVSIYSSDKDLLQLIDDTVTVYLNKKGIADLIPYTPEKINEVYELKTEQLIDLKAMMGDPSDNLKGIPSVGEKTAIKLLKEYGTLDNVLIHASEIKGKLGEKIREHKDDVLLCREMVTIERNAPLPITLEDTKALKPNTEALIALYEKLEFHSFLRKLSQPKQTTQTKPYTLLKTEADVQPFLVSGMSIVLETFDKNYHRSELLGFGLSDGKQSGFITFSDFTKANNLQDFLADESKKKATFDLKRLYVALKWKKYEIVGVDFDLLLAAYLVNARQTKDDMKTLVAHYDYDDLDYDDNIYGKGAKKTIPKLDIYAEHVAKKAQAVASLKQRLTDDLTSSDMLSLFTDIELPLASVLGEMEFAGIKVDQEELKKQRENLTQIIAELEDQIFEIAGFEFNIASTKQLAEILFDRLELKSGKKTKTGYSTDIEVLNELKNQHPIIPPIIAYRQWTKLYSTYIEGLRTVIFEDGKVHTIFQQALTATGRLSSIEPNLQNIPIRTDEGREIRKMFVPSKPGYVLLSADYSQIELRILAHMSDDQALIEAFERAEDIHEKTAKAVLGKQTVTLQERGQAKAVNFGIIYGIGAFSLSNDIGVTIQEAQAFIDQYLSVYPNIKIYMDDIVNFAKEHGYVKTLLNRRRYIPELNAKSYPQREFGKRTAMNAPIQGTAADIIKKAMIDMHDAMKKLHLKSTMLIQVHDELVFEVPESELDMMTKLLPDIMEKTLALKVPLVATFNAGKNWFDLK